MPKRPDPLDTGHAILLVENALRQAAVSPTILAYKPHENQEKFHRSTAKEKLYIGGNRSGKTVGGGAEATWWLTGTHPYRKDIPKPPVRGRMVGVDLEDGIKKIAIPEVKRWMPPQYLLNGSWDDSYDKQSRTLTLKNGSFLEFMSYEQEVPKFAGTSRHFIWFDEEPPEDIFNECMMRLVDTDGSWWITMTPLIEMSWTKDTIFDPWAEGDTSVFVLQVDTEENPHIKMEALSRLTRKQSEAERITRTSGAYITHTGLVYAGCFDPNIYNPSTNTGNVLEDIITSDQWQTYRNPRQWQHFVGFDHGLRNPTVFLFAAVDKYERMVIYDEIYETENIVKENAQLYLQRLELLRINPDYIMGDPSIQNRDPITGTSIQMEYADAGVYISLANNDIAAGVARVQSRLKNRLVFITKRCENTLREINNYRWDRYASSKIEVRRNKKEVPLKKNDHAMDAKRYLVVSRPALDGEVDLPVGNVLNSPVSSLHGIDFDYEKAFSTPGTNNTPLDEYLGSEW